MGEKRFLSRADETLLEAATRQTIIIPCGCASGMCGTCRVTLVEGSVAMQHAGGISAEEEAQGYILACSSRPRSDVTIALRPGVAAGLKSSRGASSNGRCWAFDDRRAQCR